MSLQRLAYDSAIKIKKEFSDLDVNVVRYNDEIIIHYEGESEIIASDKFNKLYFSILDSSDFIESKFKVYFLNTKPYSESTLLYSNDSLQTKITQSEYTISSTNITGFFDTYAPSSYSKPIQFEITTLSHDSSMLDSDYIYINNDNLGRAS